MTIKIAFLLVFVMAISLVGSAYAHKSEVVGDYKIEVGWKNEPPVTGIDNEITLTVTKATAFDKAEAEKEDQSMEGMDMGHDHSSSDAMDHSMDSSMSHDEMSHDNMIEGKTAEDYHQEALDLEAKGMYEKAAEDHHKAAELLHQEAEDLEQSGDYKGAAEHHHEAAEHHHMAAEDLEKIGMYADASEHHNQAAEHEEFAGKDLQQAGMNDEAAVHFANAKEHRDLAAQDMQKGNTGMSSDMAGIDMSSHDSMDEHDHELVTMEHMGEAATTGILKGFTADVVLGDNDYPLNLVEDTKYPGVYHAKFTPTETGYPVVHISGKLVGEDTDITFHPEQVEALNTMRPLQQIENGINPEDVQCKEGYDSYMRVSDWSALCLKPAGGEKLMLLGLVEFF